MHGRHEFKAFVEQASKDQFGLKVKLPNGNIANRIFPVRIHDLDADDIRLCESVTGGALHEIEFTYRSTGVNRPLRSKEDNPQENLNRTFYRDQINKTALAIKEIILSLKGEPAAVGKETDIRESESEFYGLKDHAKSKKNKFLIGAGILAILIITALFVRPGFIGRNNLKRLTAKDGKISVAVMPFQNMTNDTLWNIWQDGIQNILITNLTNSNPEELKVRQLETVTGIIQGKGLTDYASLTPLVANNISQKLEASVFIYGSIKQSGSAIRLNAQLIDSKTEEILKSFQIDGTSEKILLIVDSLSAMVKNFLVISKLTNKVSPEIQQFISTNSPEAYRYFIHGENAFRNTDPTAMKLFSQAIALDSNFYYAAIRLLEVYWDWGFFEEGKKWCLRIYEKKDQMPMQLRLWTEMLYASFFETPYERINYLRKLLEIDDQSPYAYFRIGFAYLGVNEYDKAIPEFKKMLKICDKWGVKPMWVHIYRFLGYSYHETGQFKKEKKVYKKAEREFPPSSYIIREQAILSLTEGDTIAANLYIEKYKSLLKEDSASEVGIVYSVAGIYYEADKFDIAEKYYRQILSLKPENPYRMNRLGWLLIETERNINEGLELVDKALALIPDNYEFMDTKGVGLYKIGKYQEALEILQKSWDLRMKYSIYSYEPFLHLEAAKKAVAGQK